MNELANFWNIILKSNTFNFAVLLLIFAVLFKKLNIKNIIEKIKQDIIQSIENAKAEREAAKQKLINAETSAKSVENEIKENLNEASIKAKSLAVQIQRETDLKIKLIEKNIEKVINAEEKTISSNLSQKTLKSAIELAKENIVKTLEENPKLHNKFIEESIGEI